MCNTFNHGTKCVHSIDEAFTVAHHVTALVSVARVLRRQAKFEEHMLNVPETYAEALATKTRGKPPPYFWREIPRRPADERVCGGHTAHTLM